MSQYNPNAHLTNHSKRSCMFLHWGNMKDKYRKLQFKSFRDGFPLYWLPFMPPGGTSFRKVASAHQQMPYWWCQRYCVFLPLPNSSFANGTVMYCIHQKYFSHPWAKILINECYSETLFSKNLSSSGEKYNSTWANRTIFVKPFLNWWKFSYEILCLHWQYLHRKTWIKIKHVESLDLKDQLDFPKSKEVEVLVSIYFTCVEYAICVLPLLVHMKLLNLLSVSVACFCLVVNVFWMKDMVVSGSSTAVKWSAFISAFLGSEKRRINLKKKNNKT